MPPTTWPSIVIGYPPPKITSRSMPVVAPSASGGSSLMKSCQACVGMPNPTAVYALSWATCTLSSAAPSIRLNAFKTPASSHTAITIGRPISAAFASAPATIRCAASVEVRDPPVREALLELAHLGLAVLHLGVDLARDEVLRAQRLEQLAHRLALDRELLEDEQRGDRAGVGVVEVVEVVVARDLAAEDRARVAH